MGVIINEKLSRILILASDTIATDMQIWEVEMKSINTWKLKKSKNLFNPTPRKTLVTDGR
jgi:hypothetical protein